MRKTRFAALLLALLLTLSMITAASAENLFQVNNFTANGILLSSTRLVSKGEIVSFELGASPSSLYEKDGDIYRSYSDISYDFAGKLTASTTAKWIHVTNGSYGFRLGFDTNETAKIRSGVVKVKGSGFKATLKFKQYRMDQVVSVKRNKNKVTIKMKYVNPGLRHYISVYGYKSNDTDDEYSYQKAIFDSSDYRKTSYTFTVKKGWHYSINIGSVLPADGWAPTLYGSGAWFTVEKTTGTELIQ